MGDVTNHIGLDKISPPYSGTSLNELTSRKKKYREKSTITFIVLAGSSFYAELAGQVYLSELIFLLYVVYRLIGAYKDDFKLQPWMLVGLVLWTFGSFLSDFAVQSEPLQSTKGFVRIFILGIDLVGLTYLIESNKNRIFLAWSALCTSFFLAFFLQPNTYARDIPWKFAFGLPASILVVLWLSARRREDWRLSVPILLLLAGIHFALGFRSMAVITAVVGMLLLVRVRKTTALSIKRSVRFRPVILALIAAGLIVFATNAYDQLALGGQLGVVAQQKAAYQAEGAFGSIFSSRNEFFLSVATIFGSPLIGGGSYSVASRQVAQSAADLYNLYGYNHVASAFGSESPAYHSEFLGLWAENGILAVPFWLGVLVVYVRGLVAVLYRWSAAPALVAMVATIGIWDLFFSPFGADRRIWLALSVITVISLTREKGELDAKVFNRYRQF